MSGATATRGCDTHRGARVIAEGSALNYFEVATYNRIARKRSPKGGRSAFQDQGGPEMARWGKNNVRLQVILSREQAKLIRRVARQQGVSISKMVRRLLTTVAAAQ